MKYYLPLILVFISVSLSAQFQVPVEPDTNKVQLYLRADSVLFGLPVERMMTVNGVTEYVLYPHAPAGRSLSVLKQLPYSPIGRYITVSGGIWTFDTVKNTKPLLVLNCRAKLNERWNYAEGEHSVELVKKDVVKSDTVLTFLLDGTTNIEVSGKRGLLSFPNLVVSDNQLYAKRSSIKTPTKRSLKDYENGTVKVVSRNLGFGSGNFNYYTDSFYNRRVSADSSKITFTVFHERIYDQIDARDQENPFLDTIYESSTGQRSYDFTKAPVILRTPEALLHRAERLHPTDSIFVTAEMRWSSHFKAFVLRERHIDIFKHNKDKGGYSIEIWGSWDYQYIDGIGHQYNSCPESESCSSSKIVYFRNGQKEIGTHPRIKVGIGRNGLEKGALKCYPNPVSTGGSISLRLSDKSSSVITWYTLDGHELRSEQASGAEEVTLSVDLAPGSYLLEVLNDGGRSVQKVVVFGSSK